MMNADNIIPCLHSYLFLALWLAVSSRVPNFCGANPYLNFPMTFSFLIIRMQLRQKIWDNTRNGTLVNHGHLLVVRECFFTSHALKVNYATKSAVLSC